MHNLPLLFAGPIQFGPRISYTAIYAFAFVSVLATVFVIYQTRTIPYQLVHRRQMLFARYIAPLVGLAVGFFGYVYNNQTTYLITIPIFLIIVLEVLISVWIWHEVNITVGKHKKIFSRKTNITLVVLGCIAIITAGISAPFALISEKEGQRRRAYDFCVGDFRESQKKVHHKYYATYEEVKNAAVPRCGQDPRLTEL